ncbi:GumC family protein [Croceibacterium mercuriale]|uniref:GumC family protein n=1 Tax=Croceibacterium mercuriale TaxID=1572751 RepID=UPI00069070E0|nr:polysaccharide biosynthesis tyrosine autokinase [Croceibacterium mercuriale]
MDATHPTQHRPLPAYRSNAEHEQFTDRESSVSQLSRYVIGLIRRNIWLIAIILAVAIIAAVVLTMLQTPRYTAMSTLEIAEDTQQVLGEDLGAETTSYGNWDIEMNLNTQLEILRSRALAERVAERLDLASNERFLNAMEAAAVVELPEQARAAQAADLLRANFNVDLPSGTRIAELSFTSTDAGMSAQVVDAFASEFIQANLQRKFDSSAYARTFVAEQLEESRVRLENSERELNAYAREAGLIRTRDPSAEEGAGAGSMTASSLMQLNEAANAAQAARISAQARWDAERAQPLFSSQAVLESATVQVLMQRHATLQAELDSARERYLPDHPAVTRLRTELQATETSMNRAANEVRNSIRANFQAASSAETSLREQVSTLEGDTLAEQDRSVRYNTLAREADTNRQIYDGLLQRYRALNAAAGITASNIAVVDRAEVPSSPSSPNLPGNVLIAMVLGLALAGAVVFLRDQMDDRLRIPEDVESKIGLPLLGVIPTAEDGNPVAALDDPKSPVAESYNSLRTTLMHSTREGLPRLLLITSAQASEGKTTTSYAIARSFARVGKNVLLIDADLRRPNVHKVADVSNKAGMSTLLVGEASLADVAVQSTYPGLSILPAGPIPPSPAELLSSPRMAALLEQVESEYDLVVIDSAPILGLADSTELAALVDGVALVVEANRGRGGQLKGALRRLRATNPVLVGAVLTKYDASKGGSYSYSGYNYYRYESDENAAA